MKIDDISSWDTYVAVAKTGSFTGGAAALKGTVSQVSKKISRMESQLGIRLFTRSTRSVALTAEGQALLPRVTAALEELRGIEASFENQEQVTGKVRVTCVPFIAHKLLLPSLDQFMKAYPGIRLELDLSETVADLVKSDYDVAIRIDEPEDSRLVYKKLVPNDLILCASPRYLKTRGTPKTARELKGHDLLMLSIHRGCRLTRSGLRLGAFEGAKKITCEDGAFLAEMARSGHGILVRSIWDVREDLKTGKLVQVLKNDPLETFGHLYAVIPSRRYLAPRVRVFLDFVVRTVPSDAFRS